jgi:quinol-cytochrome oxidoreductase complex cytochrome b subunit
VAGGTGGIDWQKVVTGQQKYIEDQKAEKIRQNFIELQSKLFEKASAYTNIILLGGYAGAFTIWNFTKGQLPDKATIIIASLLAISLLTFVIYEVYKMVLTQLHFHRISQLLNKEHAPDVFLEKFKEFKQRGDRKALSFIPLWISVVLICIVSALGALAILFYNFFAILLKLPGWPA